MAQIHDQQLSAPIGHIVCLKLSVTHTMTLQAFTGCSQVLHQQGCQQCSYCRR